MKYGPKTLGLTLIVAIGVMAVSAAAAQAAEVGSLKVNGVALGVEEGVTAAGTGEALKLLSPGIGTIECEGSTVSASGGNYIENGGKKELLLHLHALFLALWKGCHIAGNKFCSIYPSQKARETKTESGLVDFHALLLWLGYHIITVEPLLHMDYVKLTTVAGLPGFATLYFGGALCALNGVEAVLSGTTALRVPDFTEETVEHSFQDLTAAEEKELAEEGMSLGLTLEKESAEIDGGNAKLHLTGALEGKTYSVE